MEEHYMYICRHVQATPPETCAVLEDLLDSAQQHGEDGLLDLSMAVDGRSQRVSEHLKRVIARALAGERGDQYTHSHTDSHTLT